MTTKYRNIACIVGMVSSSYLVRASDNLTLPVLQLPFNNSVQKSDSTSNDDASEFTVSLTAGNNLVQKGKKAAGKMPYLTPTVGYSFASGIYLNLSGNYITNAKKKPLDNISLEAGYTHTFGDHFSIDLGYTFDHYFTKKQVASTEPGTVALALSWDGKIVTPTLTTSYAFGQTSDLTHEFTLDHSFDFDKVFCKNDQLSFPVTIGISAGTSNFYKAYVTNNTVKKKNGTIVTPDEVNTKFAVTSYTYGAGIAYTVGHFSMSSDISMVTSTNNPTDISLSTAPEITVGLSLTF